ncbi:hypothetical protein BDV29DRAFT_186724 [Aspergillus leporis]|uniref:Succinate dehydrogenase cytochrome b560 subunit n=1 Tax=Aspergillus leporis TaxID=41062 RepID=A0A5N5WFT8_9EURO|nr:hypothetical protein BDV29DRAFT_186724 [Aspergillus leporis]
MAKLSAQLQRKSSHDRLALQRRRRLVVPHLTVYKWRYVSLASILHRISGLTLSGSLYGFATVYLLAPALGLHLDSTTLITAFGSLTSVAQVVLKFGVAMPFTYHGFNGLKHLMWDQGHFLNKKQGGRAAQVVLGASISASLGLALWEF